MQSLSNSAVEVILLHMDSIASATQLANHDQDPTKALLMWHQNHYPRASNTLLEVRKLIPFLHLLLCELERGEYCISKKDPQIRRWDS